MRIILSLTALLLASPPLAARTPQEGASPEAGCTGRVSPPAGFEGWSRPTPISAGTRPGDGATVGTGKAIVVSLHPARHLSLSPQPEKTADPASNGGTLALAILTPGTYRVALGGAAWVDLVHDGKAVAAASHGHGPKCSGIRKIVDFRLAPGNYAIQVSGSAAESLALMIAKS